VDAADTLYRADMARHFTRARGALATAAAALAVAATFAATAAAGGSEQKVDPTTARMKALPPASLDDTLAIGGTEIDAKTLASRMTVPVKVNGQGPYRFIVDSGADSSVVGERIAQSLKLLTRSRSMRWSTRGPR
jgi:predicted aspartyl protease